MKRNVLAIIISIVIMASPITVYADDKSDETVTYLGGIDYEYIGDSYDVFDNSPNGIPSHEYRLWIPIVLNKKEITLDCYDLEVYYNSKVKVPDSYTDNKGNKRYVTSISGSCAFKAFDLNPKNKYMSLIDNVVFSKDGKTLMSYAIFDERTEYKIPDGTNIIAESSFVGSQNIEHITIPDSVNEIQKDAFFGIDKLKEINIPPLVEVLDNTFWSCYDLENVYIPKNSKLKKIDGGAFRETKVSELTLPNFEVKISNLAFGKKEIAEKVKLKSYVKPNVSFECDNNVCTLKWDKIANASHYEVYQKKSDGSYKILKTVKGSSIKINGLKNDKKYTFAVKAVAKVKATPYNQDNYIVSFSDLPEYYTIEGTLSDDVTVIGWNENAIGGHIYEWYEY